MSHGLKQPILSAPILIVDDVASEAITLDLLCRSLGVETVQAASAAEASAVLGCIRPAAIITDLLMPGADGLDCLFMIAEKAPSVPVMVVTASEQQLLKAAGELGITYGLRDLTCVAKPVGLGTLQAFLARAGIRFKPPQAGLH
jgi:CheY-like chemotaxis protein